MDCVEFKVAFIVNDHDVGSERLSLLGIWNEGEGNKGGVGSILLEK